MIKTFDEFNISENEGHHSYGCAMLYFIFDKIDDIQSEIDEDDLINDGFENDPHVTLLYGLHKEVNDTEVFDIIDEYDIPTLELYNISAFKTDEYDVLKFDVRQYMEEYSEKDDILFKINKSLCKLPYTSDFPDYHPHATIAYLKAGTSNKYIKQLKDLTYKVKANKIVYSAPTDTDDIITTKKI
jgi:2'-5' RNA ligase